MADIEEDFEFMSEDFEYGSEMYMFEPEYSAEELRLREEERLARASSPMRDEENPQRTESLFWCKCGHCELKPLAIECLCCQAWPEWRWRPDDSDPDEENTNSGCITEMEDVVHLLHRAVLETFFLNPKINWKKRPKPEGANGHLSTE